MPPSAAELAGYKEKLKSLRGLARAVSAGGLLIYTNQPWHPQLELIARSLVGLDGKLWVMRCRTQLEMDQLAAAAGFIGISNLMEGVVQAKGEVKLASGQSVPASLPDECDKGDTVQLSVRPEKIALDDIQKGLVSLEGVIEQRVYQGITTQVTVSLGNGAKLVALEQQTYRADSTDRWEPGAKVKLGWHPEHCLVLR